MGAWVQLVMLFFSTLMCNVHALTLNIENTGYLQLLTSECKKKEGNFSTVGNFLDTFEFLLKLIVKIISNVI